MEAAFPRMPNLSGGCSVLVASPQTVASGNSVEIPQIGPGLVGGLIKRPSFGLPRRRRGDNGSTSSTRSKARRLTCELPSAEQPRPAVRGREKAPAQGLSRGGGLGLGVTLVEELLPGQRTSRRYLLDGASGEVRVEEGGPGPEDGGAERALALRQRAQAFFLPAGYPHTVTPDYLAYMVWEFPVHVTGWASSTLVTSTLLAAVGIGGSPSSAAAATAAIKWVSKDGIGAFGRLLIGGRFGSLFDEDPKQWRMYADFIGSAGSLFELATPLAPGSFLLLASLGNLTKAVAKGLKDPSWRVIQNHFARNENVGDVAAKQVVWDVIGQLMGLVIGVLILRTPGVAASYWSLVGVWAAIRALHLWLRHRSLRVLRLPTLNFKRAAILVQCHVAGTPMPGVEEANRREVLVLPRRWTRPHLRFGCSLQELLPGSKVAAKDVQALLAIYEAEDYVLAMPKGGEVKVLLKEGSSGLTLLRCLWQAEWLRRHADRGSIPGSTTPGSAALQQRLMPRDNQSIQAVDVALLQASLTSMQDSFDSFIAKAGAAGWDLGKVVLRPPPGAPILRHMSSED